MENITTTDLADFGYRELKETGKIINCMMNKNTPEGFNDNGSVIMFNKNSGHVFLTNEDFEVCMVNDDDELELFITSPEDGYEALISDWIAEYYTYLTEENQKYIMDNFIKQYNCYADIFIIKHGENKYNIAIGEAELEND